MSNNAESRSSSNFSHGVVHRGAAEGGRGRGVLTRADLVTPGEEKTPFGAKIISLRIIWPIERISRGLMIIIHRARDDSDSRRDRQTVLCEYDGDTRGR